MGYYDPHKVQQQINDEYKIMIKDMNNAMQAMNDEAKKMLDEVRRMKENFTWGAWEKHTVGLMPKRINGKWYFRGATVYRKQRFGPGGVHYKYGDDFDVLRESDDV